MQASRKLEHIKPSASIEMAAIAARLRAEGKPVLNLTIGEPNFLPAEHICNAAAGALKRGETGYITSEGIQPLRDAIADRLWLDSKVRYNPVTEILVVPGVKQGLWYIFATLLNEGDEVLTPEPCWVSYATEAILAGGRLIGIPTSTETNHFPTKEQWEAYITPKTRIILINTPCNPTGRVYTTEELAIIAELAQHYDLIVVADEIYSRIVFDSADFMSIAALPGMKERTIIANGFSKAYAMPGFRVGYLAGPASMIDLCGLINQHIATCVGAMSQHAALSALTGPQDWVEDMVEAYQKRRDVVARAISSNSLLAWDSPEGTFYGWIDLTAVTDGDASGVARRLLARYGIASVDGTAFDSLAYGKVRISLAADDETVERAAGILAGLSSLSFVCK